MGCPFGGGNNVKIKNKCHALGQGGFCVKRAQKSTKFQSKGVQKLSRI